MGLSLLERMDAALASGPLPYIELARRLWPETSKAWRHAHGGGPPGCYMALSSGIRRGGFTMGAIRRASADRLVYPRKH